MSSSDDDVPLIGQRNATFLANKQKQILVDSDDEQSDLPSWLVNHKSPVKGSVPIPISSDSDEDLKEVLSPAKLLSQRKQPPIDLTQAGPSQPTQAAPPSTKGKKAAPTTAARKKSISFSQPEVAVTNGTQDHPTKPKEAPAAKTVRVLPTSAHELAIMLPEKLPQFKMLVELESTGEVHGATDLSGDSGAIGRMIVNKDTSGNPCIQLDLKGILYNATLVPSAVTMAVVNLSGNEGKVECLLDDFVQLREDPTFAEARGAMLDDLLYEDEDETYAMGDDDGGDGSGGKGKGKKVKAAAGKGKAAGGKAKPKPKPRKPAAGGVKKTAAKGKPKAKAKPKSKAK